MINRNGTKNASIAAIATGHLTRFWLVMDPTRIFTARLATANDSDRKVSAMVTHLLWSALQELLIFPLRPNRESRLPKVKVVLVADSSSTLPSR